MSSSAESPASAYVLVVEDDPTNATLIQDYLLAHGYEVAIAEDGAQGLTRASERRPDIAIVDVLLPGQSGLEFLRALRAAPKGADLPILLMSAVWKEAHPEAPKPGEVQGYLVKPFRMSALVDRIREVLG